MKSFLGPAMDPKVVAKWLVAAPKVLQAIFAALSDWYSWRLAEKLYGHGSAAAWSVVSTPSYMKSTDIWVTHKYV